MILDHIVCSIKYKYLYYNYSIIYIFYRKLRIDYDNIFYFIT